MSRAVVAALFSVLMASCTSSTDPNLELGNPGFSAAMPVAAEPAAETEQQATADDMTVPQPAQPTMSAEADAPLPEQVAYLPGAKPTVGFPTVGTETATIADAAAFEAAREGEPQLPQSAPIAIGQPAPVDAQPQQVAEAPAAAEDEGATKPTAFLTAGDPVEQPIAPKKKGFLSSFFGSTPAQAAAPKPVLPQQKAKPIITLASAPAEEAKPLVMASLGDDNPLPGVRQTALFEIKRKSGIDDDSDVDLHEDEEGAPIQLASAAGLARLAPNGLLKQTDNVDVACLKPSLVRVLKTIEQHYGKKMVVTSGYRSPSHNRRARGAKNSLHMYCAAVDVQISGISKWELAKYVRTMPGRGGVGTYCHTESVHIDVGPERDWNWRCRRRK